MLSSRIQWLRQTPGLSNLNLHIRKLVAHPRHKHSDLALRDGAVAGDRIHGIVNLALDIPRSDTVSDKWAFGRTEAGADEKLAVGRVADAGYLEEREGSHSAREGSGGG